MVVDVSPRLTARTGRVAERVEQAHIVQLLRSLGAAVYVLGTVRRRGDYPGTMQTPGLPDLYVVLPPARLPATRPTLRGHSPLWVEVKAQGGRLRPAQVAFQAQCIVAGVPHVVGGLDAVIAYLIAGGWLAAASVPHYRRPAPPAGGRDARAAPRHLRASTAPATPATQSPGVAPD